MLRLEKLRLLSVTHGAVREGNTSLPLEVLKIFVNKQQGQILVPPSSEGGDDAEQSNAASKTTVSSDEVLTQKVVSKGKVPLSPT